MIHCLLENAILNDGYALFGVFGDVLSPETDNCPPKIIQFLTAFMMPNDLSRRMKDSASDSLKLKMDLISFLV